MTNSQSNTTDNLTDNPSNEAASAPTTDGTNSSGPIADGTTTTESTTRALYHALKRLNRLMHRMGHQEPAHHGLFRGQTHLLETIRANDGIVQRDLADVLDIRPSSLTEMLAKMEQDGFVERKQDDNDQRLMHIHLTTKGMQYLEMMAESEDYQMNTLFGSLTEEEARTMLTLCGKLGTGLEQKPCVPKEKSGCGRGGHGHHCKRHGGGHSGEGAHGDGHHGKGPHGDGYPEKGLHGHEHHHHHHN